MAKAKKETGPGFDKDGIPCPNPAPKIGDKVNYIWPPGVEPLALGGTIRPGTVTAVYDGFDGRLVDLSVETLKEPVVAKSAPWRSADDNAGNTWHQPEAAA
jgi:hypothetical protein